MLAFTAGKVDRETSGILTLLCQQDITLGC